MIMGKHKMHKGKGKYQLTEEKRMMFVIASASAVILGFLVWISL